MPPAMLAMERNVTDRCGFLAHTYTKKYWRIMNKEMVLLVARVGGKKVTGKKVTVLGGKKVTGKKVT